MAQPANLLKAELREIKWDKLQQVQKINPDKTVQVQFNPETLKVNYSNQNVGGDQRGGPAIQFVGAGTTKLSLQLWFDATVPLADGTMQQEGDVRHLTEKVVYFITPKKVDKNKWVPPGLRFIWGTFLFDGVMDSLDENLEFFSEDGKPLRASISISLSSQKIQFEFGDQQPLGGRSREAAGTQAHTQARAGDTVQKMAARAGRSNDWKAIAAANNIENPRQLTPGTLLNTNVNVPAQASASIRFGGSAGLSASGNIGLSGSAGLGASGNIGLSGSAGLGASGNIGLSGSAGLGTSGNIGLSGSAGLGASGNIGLSGSAEL